MGEGQKAAPRAQVVARISARKISAIGAASLLCIALAACGGRPSQPVPERTALDDQLSCSHVISEKRKLKARIKDLQDERNENRKRSLARVPGAVVSGNPFSAIFFADPSVAIYKEINAAKRRNRVLDQLLRQKGCIAPAEPVAAPAAEPPVVPASAPAQPQPPAEAEPLQISPPTDVTIPQEPAEASPPTTE